MKSDEEMISTCTEQKPQLVRGCISEAMRGGSDSRDTFPERSLNEHNVDSRCDFARSLNSTSPRIGRAASLPTIQVDLNLSISQTFSSPEMTRSFGVLRNGNQSNVDSFNSTNESDAPRNGNEDGVDTETDESIEQRRTREDEESEALARQLMAEEALASYNMSTQYLQENAGQFSSEDLAAIQAAVQEDIQGDELHEGDSIESADLSYDTLLRLGERLGDVKQERWTLCAQTHIDKLPSFAYKKAIAQTRDENDSLMKCLVCQCCYERGETLRRLPCNHVFHMECVDQWLGDKDICPYCRQSIVRRSILW